MGNGLNELQFQSQYGQEVFSYPKCPDRNFKQYPAYSCIIHKLLLWHKHL